MRLCSNNILALILLYTVREKEKREFEFVIVRKMWIFKRFEGFFRKLSNVVTLSLFFKF